MSRAKLLAATLGGVLASMAPLAATNAQSGDALAQAEQACLDNGVRPYTTAYNTCVDRAAVAFDRGAYDFAYRQARAVRHARDVCYSYGVSPATLGYRECLNAETDRQAGRIHEVYYSPPTKTVTRYGYVIEPDPGITSP